MLLEINEIKNKMDELFKDNLPALCLNRPGLTEIDVNHAESLLSVSFPAAFRKIIQLYDFGKFSIGSMSFGYKGNYGSFLIEMNQTPEVQWWSEGERPQNYILVAGTDGHVLIENLGNEYIFAYLRIDFWRQNRLVCKGFEDLIRIAGTVYLTGENYSEKEALVHDLLDDDELDSSFWVEFAKGIT